jgi:precorrin-3B synthase
MMLARNPSTANASRQGSGERRGLCPGLSAPMPTGDGLLVRLMPVGTISLPAFSGLCAAAREHGNGVIEISSRGSIQVRGLSVASAPLFADAIAALDITTADGVPVLSNALAGFDAEEILDAGAVAADLRRALAETSLAARLAPKVSVTIDGGGALGLDQIVADIRLRAETANGAAAFRVSVGGDGGSATQVGAVASADGVDAAARLLEAIARRGRAARARDVLAAEGGVVFRSAIADLLLPDAPPQPSSGQSCEAIGTHRLRDGSLACGVGLAFGHADAGALEQLVEAAGVAGATGLRVAAGRALLVIGLTPDTCSYFVAAGERLGFIVQRDDPRRHVFACAGAPICSSAHIAARAIAPSVARLAAPHLNAAFQIHISACAKGCAHAQATALTIVGVPAGCALIADGSAGDMPFATVATEELPAAIVRCVRGPRREGGHV